MAVRRGGLTSPLPREPFESSPVKHAVTALVIMGSRPEKPAALPSGSGLCFAALLRREKGRDLGAIVVLIGSPRQGNLVADREPARLALGLCTAPAPGSHVGPPRAMVGATASVGINIRYVGTAGRYPRAGYSTAASTVVVTSFTAPRAVFAQPESSTAHKRMASKVARRFIVTSPSRGIEEYPHSRPASCAISSEGFLAGAR